VYACKPLVYASEVILSAEVMRGLSCKGIEKIGGFDFIGFSPYATVVMEGMRKTVKDPNQNSQCPSQNFPCPKVQIRTSTT
jgi:hypothetical protein